MAQFNYLNEFNNIMSFDGAITKGPLPRWQKKELDASTNSSTGNISRQKLSISQQCNASVSSKTPSKHKQGNNKKSPSKTPKKCSSTPTPSKLTKTPIGDRFIPSRANSNFELGHFKFNQSSQENGEDKVISSRECEMQRHVNKALGSNPNQRILAYSNKAPAAPDSHQNPLKVVYSQTRTPASAKAGTRYIPHAPDRILDAPEIIDDYYLNLLDWSPDNILAVALGNQVFLWHAEIGSTEELLEYEGNEHVCSLAWVGQGNHLAVGTSEGSVEVWDCNHMKRLRIMSGHIGRVGSLSWNNYVISSGSRTGNIIHSDVRQREHLISNIEAHTQEVCGLKWSPDGRYLASGGNDNILNVWSAVRGQCYGEETPLHVFNSHQAAVKAIAWCPWQMNILASGGGTADRCIKIWNVSNGNNISSTDTHSQVCALCWAPHYKELVSGHGFTDNQLIIWKFPAMTKQAELRGHTARVLNLAISPDGTTVMSAGADETLRLWKCFIPDPLKKKAGAESKSKQSLILRQCIR
uniref:Putative anaphase promoting complex cdc20 cdh1 and ama1 subunit n=1 Tax=Xenopsylla cheopis TaxID=163159 RepID=A0A6M2DIJ8_XENCH